ncbi:MAG TPA: hypothetical protein VKU44_09180, partial [Terriglobia bacterium]|nr:hypothetical protein [Terriglobia bacterium]
PIALDATVCPHCQSPQSPASRERKLLNSILFWVGVSTALISLILGFDQVKGLFKNFRHSRGEISQLVASGNAERDRGDYAVALDSYESASQLDANNLRIQGEEAKLAMLWLENMHAGGDGFTPIANKLLPILDRALTRAQGAQAADLLAHVGWAHFLRLRDGADEGTVIEDSFRRALALDSGNPYAHAMWGFWILWQSGKLQDADQHFGAALASGRVRPYVRELEISALNNTDRLDTETELIRVSDDMRKRNETMSAPDRSRILSSYERKLPHHDELAQLLGALPPADAQATYQWLDAGSDRPETKDEAQRRRWRRVFVEASIEEVADHRPEALAMYRSLQSELHGSDSSLEPSVADALARLSPKP